VLALVCEAVARFALHLGMPYKRPVLNEAWGVDLLNYERLFPFVHTANFFQSIRGIVYEYPAPVALLYGFFLSFHHPVRVLMFTLLLVLLSVTFAFALRLHHKGFSATTASCVAGGTLLLSYPVAFELKQGNMELFVSILVGAGVYCFLQNKFRLAAICIGTAGAMKIFPFVYLGLFLTRSRYRALGTAILSAVIITVVSLFYLDPSLGVAWHGVQNGLSTYQRELSPIISQQTSYDHSIFALLKLLRLEHARRMVVSASAVHRYLICVAVGGVILFWTRIRRMPVTNQVICLCIASIILPPVSFDYTLINLYIPWAMLVCFAIDRRNVKTPGLTAAFVCFAIATSIQTEAIYHGRSAGGQIKAIVLCILMGIALRYPFGEDTIVNPQLMPDTP
jgi:hypothetical protein